jgi:hypothetical protein
METASKFTLDQGSKEADYQIYVRLTPSLLCFFSHTQTRSRSQKREKQEKGRLRCPSQWHICHSKKTRTNKTITITTAAIIEQQRKRRGRELVGRWLGLVACRSRRKEVRREKITSSPSGASQVTTTTGRAVLQACTPITNPILQVHSKVVTFEVCTELR